MVVNNVSLSMIKMGSLQHIQEESVDSDDEDGNSKSNPGDVKSRGLKKLENRPDDTSSSISDWGPS